MDLNSICRLYSSVLSNDMFGISEWDIRAGIQNMGKAYSTECANFNSESRDFPNFNSPAFRCAYLHKYAPLHTYIACDVMLAILKETELLFRPLIRSGRFSICSLGGGPGSDVIGVLSALHFTFNFFKCSATVIDCMKEWEQSFSSLIQQLKYGKYGSFSQNLDQNFGWNYIGANLLQNMTNEVNRAIASASFVTMMKFVSAASCASAEGMLEKIFRVMKPGAFVLFIDNAAGGFIQAVERASRKYSFQVIADRRHVHYNMPEFTIQRFGYSSCIKTTVSILLLRKTEHNNIVHMPILAPLSFNTNNADNLNLRNTNANSNKSPDKLDNLILRMADANSNKLPSNSNDLNAKLRNTNPNSSKSPVGNLNISKNNDNSNKLTGNKGNSSAKLRNAGPNSCKSPSKVDKSNDKLRKASANSKKSPVKEANLNHNFRKSDSSSPHKLFMNTSDSTSPHKLFTNTSDSTSPHKLFTNTSNFNSISRDTNFSAINNQIRPTSTTYNFPSSSSARATGQRGVSAPSADNRRSFSVPNRNIPDETENDACCTCCVIS